MAHQLNTASKRRIIREVIIGARVYQNHLVAKSFLIVTEDGEAKEVCFHKDDFAHLVGVRSTLNDLDFYNHCIKGTLTESNIKAQQHYDFGTIRKKIVRIKKINRIIYANAKTNLVLINLHTNTTDFPLAIESIEDKMVVAFTGKDNHARSLRNNNQSRSDEKKNIIAIFSKNKLSKDLYNTLIYIKRTEILADDSKPFRKLISEKMVNKINIK